MLLNFSVSNFCSFGETAHFTMEAGRTRNFAERTARTPNAKILKFKAVYGANASGKSNLVKAIDFMQRAVMHGVPSDAISDYCRMRNESISEPSIFEVEVVLDEIRYVYGFKVLLSSGVFIQEWLKEKKRQKIRNVFIRDTQNGTYNVTSYANDAMLNDRLRIYADDVKQDGSILFLRVMNQNKESLYGENSPIKIYRTLYYWFRHRLSVNYPDEPITQYNYFFDSQGSLAAERLLAQLDTGISKVNVYDEPVEKVMAQFPKEFRQGILDTLSEQRRHNEENNIDEISSVMVRSREGHSMYIIELVGEDVNCKTLKFNHKHSTSLFSLGEESDGTIRLLDLLEVLLSTTPNMVYVIDEISRCLHPLLTKQFVQNFLALAAERNVQLIATTHEANLMDLDLLRQDEIGFVGKRDDNGTSILYGLEEFGARFDKRIRKAYLEGQYNAVPKFNKDS